MLSAFNHEQIQAAILAFKAADKDLRKDINAATRETMNPVWRGIVSANTAGIRSPGGRVLNAGVRIAAGNPPRALAAQSRRPIGRQKRIRPSEHYWMWEFGAGNPNRKSVYERRNRTSGGAHKVVRRASRGLPRRVDKGRAVYPAFAEIAPRMTSLWVQLIVRKYYEAAEKAGR